MSRQLNAEIHLLHVLEEPFTSDSKRIAMEKLMTVGLPSEEMNISVVREVLHGVVPNEIVAYARQHRVEMIIVGTRGRSGLLQVALGSVTQRVLKNAPCPVVVVNQGSEVAEVPREPSDAQYLELKNPESAALDLVARAISLRATDIHMDPLYEERYQIRLRIDGVVMPYCAMDRSVAEHMIHQYMTMAQMNLGDPFRPDEGRLHLPKSVQNIEVRMTTSPVAGGRAVALRIFSKEKVFVPLEQLGFSAKGLEEVHRILRNQEGLVLVTGPTGSGKTTTVYSMLESFGSKNCNIVSIEDPVEFNVAFVRQINVDEQHGVTMTSGLRTVLRMDPDIIFVGEIRDNEAAQIALQASCSGVLVFSSLHAKDVAASIVMLRELGMPPKAIASGLAGVINQRLVRQLCSQCKKRVDLDPKMAPLFLEECGVVPTHVFVPSGCDHCRGTGYWGRTGIFEIIACDEHIAKAIVDEETESVLRKTMRDHGALPLIQDALMKVMSGVTSIDEVNAARWL